MDCPSCGAQTRTLETRRAERGAAVRRRRHCPACEGRFTTFERREPEPLYVVKRDGSRQRFDAAKLRGALKRAAHKRPVGAGQIDAIVSRIAAEAERAGGEVSADAVRELCLDGLAAVDTGAYLQFAGVELGDVDSVRKVLDRVGAGSEQPGNPRKKGAAGRSAAAGSVRDGEDAPRPPQTERARGEN